jgi:hypothetical protein
MGHVVQRSIGPIPYWSLSYYLSSVSHRRGTVFDLDVVWGKGKHTIGLRLVGIAHTSRIIRWYLTTVPRSQLSAPQIIQAYRLRWLVELLFREINFASVFSDEPTRQGELGRGFVPHQRQGRGRCDVKSTPTCVIRSSTTSSRRSRPWMPT